jgi:hypothetical protein
MATPSQGLIVCKTCGQVAVSHKTYRLHCAVCVKAMQAAYQRKYREKQKAAPRAVECKGCGKQFDASASGRTWRCAECTRLYLADYRQKNKERHAGYSRDYRAKLGDEYRDRMRQRRATALASMTPEEAEAFRKAECDKSRRLFDELRKQVFEAYGGYRCTCCGETNPLFLSIDHVNNDGAQMRRNGEHGRSGTAFYQWLRKSGFPAGFQVLCMNCNIGKHRNGGVCPHQSSKV